MFFWCLKMFLWLKDYKISCWKFKFSKFPSLAIITFQKMQKILLNLFISTIQEYIRFFIPELETPKLIFPYLTFLAEMVRSGSDTLLLFFRFRSPVMSSVMSQTWTSATAVISPVTSSNILVVLVYNSWLYLLDWQSDVISAPTPKKNTLKS